MTGIIDDKARFHNTFLLVLALGTSALFLYMIWGFVVALGLAAIFAGLSHQSYVRLTLRFGGRRYLAAATVIALLVLIVVVPLTGILAIAIKEAAQLSEIARPWIEEQIANPARFEGWLADLGVLEQIAPYRDDIITKAGEWAGAIAGFLANSVATATRGTASAIIAVFVMLYAMLFFLVNGRATLEKVLYYIPLDATDEHMLLERFTSVTRATLQGTLLIGIIQGALAGLAFAVAGLDGVVFWGLMMAVLSIIPGVGIAIVWVPATAYLLWIDRTGAAIGLAAWCGLVAGMVDNILRPRLVGQDAKMSDLLILVSTLGGLTLFGAVGIILGPVLAASYVAVWELFGRSFAPLLPKVDLGPDQLAPPTKVDAAAEAPPDVN